MERENTWNIYSEKQLQELELFTKDYMDFLDAGKTERECADIIVNLIEKEGYVELEKLMKNNQSIKQGDKVYSVCMNKAVIMFHVGSKPLEEGMNILGAHIDSPRLDVKQNPLYEDTGFAYFDTHYYGGIKKYQWVALPLAIHGVIVKKDGTTVEVNIGDEEGDPVFFISDLLIHLSEEQMEKKASKVIEGEALDIIIGSKPIKIEESKQDKTDLDINADKENEDKENEDKKAAKDAVKKGILAILKETYEMDEEDFLSAELEVVPAGTAKEAGFDRSMIMAYGQDDRVCAFTSLRAMFEVENPERTTCCILTDKEEIGSVGATGMRSMFFENSVAEFINLMGEYSDLYLRRCLKNSCMLSSDVTTAYDPSFALCFDKKNVAYFGKGMVFNKFTGSKGKSGSNDANAEYIAMIRNILEKDNINFQFSELGRVDLGGGGTIAYILALYGMNVIDCGVAVLNMHAPWEVTSKADIYETKRGYVTFLEGACM
ncbi:MAG TPA: aminopeptidase [Lachnospiraceae bacterium]|nr:aminopeptidase [Lachnospiraceae bacterium]